MSTSVNGCTSNTAVKLAVGLAASVSDPIIGVKEKPAKSSSSVSTKTVCVAKEENAGLDENGLMLTVMELVTVPSSVRSSTLVTDTVLELFQSLELNTRTVVVVLTCDSVESRVAIFKITNSPGLGSALRTTVKLTVLESPSNRSPP